MKAFEEEVWDCHALEKGERVGNWRVDSFVACGGFGAVYRVVSGSREAAIKIFSGDLRKDKGNGCRRIEQEIQILKASAGRYSPKLYEAGKHRGRPYFVMEYVDGVKPSEMPSGNDEIREFMLGLIDAVARLHSDGWIHCDIKPHNIGKRRSDGTYVLLDFGSSERPDEEDADEHRPRENTMNMCTMGYQRVGTRGYEPPESTYRPSRDIYAIGHVLRDCFQEEVPPHWSAVINKCISWQPRYRYKNIAALREDVDKIDKLKRLVYWKLRVDEIRRQREIERRLAKTKVVRQTWEETIVADAKSSYGGVKLLSVNLDKTPCEKVIVRDPVVLGPNTILFITGCGIIDADISGPSSSVVVLRGYAVLHNRNKVLPPKNNLTYVVVGPGTYLNFPNIDDKDRMKFFTYRRRIFRDLDATTMFRLRGPKAFSDIEAETVKGIRDSDMPKAYKKVLVDFFKGKTFTVLPQDKKAKGSKK